MRYLAWNLKILILIGLMELWLYLWALNFLLILLCAFLLLEVLLRIMMAIFW